MPDKGEKNIDHGSLAEFIKELKKAVPNATVTAGKEKRGNKSRHNHGEAIDFRENQDVLDYLWYTKEGLELLKKHNLGLLQETTSAVKGLTKATGNHYHVGKDSSIPRADKRLELAEKNNLDWSNYDSTYEKKLNQGTTFEKTKNYGITTNKNLPKGEKFKINHSDKKTSDKTKVSEVSSDPNLRHGHTALKKELSSLSKQFSNGDISKEDFEEKVYQAKIKAQKDLGVDAIKKGYHRDYEDLVSSKKDYRKSYDKAKSEYDEIKKQQDKNQEAFDRLNSQGVPVKVRIPNTVDKYKTVYSKNTGKIRSSKEYKELYNKRTELYHQGKKAASKVEEEENIIKESLQISLAEKAKKELDKTDIKDPKYQEKLKAWESYRDGKFDVESAMSSYEGDPVKEELYTEIAEREETIPENGDEETLPDPDGTDGDGDGDGDETSTEIDKAKKGDPENPFNFTSEGEESPLVKTPGVYSDDKPVEQNTEGFIKDNPMAGVIAGLAMKGLSDSQKRVTSVNTDQHAQLSQSFYEHLANLETISKRGFTPEEEAAFMKEANDGYVATIQTAVRASGGNRAQLLSQMGKANAQKNDALLQFAAKDAMLNRQNLDQYGKALQYKESFNERKSVRSQENEIREKMFMRRDDLDRREGGAALFSSSLKSLGDSIDSYKTTGPGSVLDQYRKYATAKLHNDLQTINPETGLPFENPEQYENYVKKVNEEDKTRKQATGTEAVYNQAAKNMQFKNDQEKEKWVAKVNSLSDKDKVKYSTHLEGVNDVSSFDSMMNEFGTKNNTENNNDINQNSIFDKPETVKEIEEGEDSYDIPFSSFDDIDNGFKI